MRTQYGLHPGIHIPPPLGTWPPRLEITLHSQSPPILEVDRIPRRIRKWVCEGAPADRDIFLTQKMLRCTNLGFLYSFTTTYCVLIYEALQWPTRPVLGQKQKSRCVLGQYGEKELKEKSTKLESVKLDFRGSTGTNSVYFSFLCAGLLVVLRFVEYSFIPNVKDRISTANCFASDIYLESMGYHLKVPKEKIFLKYL